MSFGNELSSNESAGKEWSDQNVNKEELKIENIDICYRKITELTGEDLW